MKKILSIPILAILGIALTFTACDKGNDPVPDVVPDPVIEYPSLRIVNDSRNYIAITSVTLLGYEFTTLDIANGSSQTFTLDKGMSGGYEDINVIVGYRRYTSNGGHPNIKVDFYDGEITTITVKGCSGAEGCPGIYLE